MGSNKRYDGYKSFQYLEAGRDYKQFKLAKEIGRVKEYKVPLSKDEEDRAKELQAKLICISLHDHTDVNPDDITQIREWTRENRISTGFEGLAASGLDAVFDGLLDGTNTVISKRPWHWDSLIYELGVRLSDLAHQKMVILGRNVEDIRRAHKDGLIAFIPSIEGAAEIENDLERIDVLHGLGVRMLGLVYSESNAIGSGLAEKNDAGLTDFGYEVVERMNKIGMAIDIAHVGDQTSLDAIEASKVPVFISHAGARSLWPAKRMKSDEVLEALANKKGVIGIEASPHTTLTEKHKSHSLESVMEHFQYVEKRFGIDYVTFGPDTMFGDHVGLHHVFTSELSMSKDQADIPFEEVPYVNGLENPGEFFNIIRWLVKHGYSDSEIEKAVGGNTLRVLEKVWK
jgi:membrane dipeptidase